MSRVLVAASAVFALIGGLLVLGGLADLQKHTPADVNSSAKPYRFVWFIWSFEVFTLLFAGLALIVNFNSLKNPLLAFVSMVTVLIINLINQVIYSTASLPGSNGSATPGNVAVAGLIIIAVGNAGIILSTAAFNMSAAAPAPTQADNAEDGVRKSIEVHV